MYLGICCNVAGHCRQNAQELGIGIIGDSQGIFGEAVVAGYVMRGLLASAPHAAVVLMERQARAG